MLQLFLSIDPDGIDYKRVEFVDPDGKVIFDDFHFLDVKRNVRAVDYANSVVEYKFDAGALGVEYGPYPVSYPSVRILDDLDPKFQIFRQVVELKGARGGRSCIVTDDLRSRLLAVRPKLRGFSFSPLMYGL